MRGESALGRLGESGVGLGRPARCALLTFAVAAWLVAGVLTARLLSFVWLGVVSDVPLLWDQIPALAARGWSLGVGAFLLIAAGATMLRAARSPTGRKALALIGAAVLLLVATGSLWWVRRTPSFPSVTASPSLEIPGTIAWLESDSESGGCLWTIAAGGGAATVVHCAAGSEDIDFGQSLGGFAPQGHLVFSRGGAADLLMIWVDSDTGEQVDAAPADWSLGGTSLQIRQDGSRLAIGHTWRGPELRIEEPGGVVTRLVGLGGPHDYGLLSAQWSPDGNWALAVDSDRRLLVVDARDPAPRVLVADRPVLQFSWFMPGHATYALKVPDMPGDDRLCGGYRYASPLCVFDWASHDSDYSSEEVRALLLVLDEENLTEAVLRRAGVAPQIAARSAAFARELESLGWRHGVDVPASPWTDPHSLPAIDPATACRWAADEAHVEHHVLAAVQPTVEAADLAGLLDEIEASLDDRRAELESCATAGLESRAADAAR